MIKIKISYNTDEEIAGVIRLLSPVMKSWRVSRNKEGRYKKAYAYKIFSLIYSHRLLVYHRHHKNSSTYLFCLNGFYWNSDI